jgi:hypothetical protein
MSFEVLKGNLSHARQAYLHAVRSLPVCADLQAGPVNQHGMVFSKGSQIESQQIELGWAFFCRYESCLEK